MGKATDMTGLQFMNWRPVMSVALPISPPIASISLARCPLARPPMAGLQDIWPMVSTLMDSINVWQPILADARAASTPA